jgi:hypothetical protein
MKMTSLTDQEYNHRVASVANVMMQSFWNLNWTWACCPKGHKFHTGEQYSVSKFGKTHNYIVHQDRHS